MLLFTRADIHYSRDEFILSLLTRLKPKASLAYEAHLFSQSERGAALQRQVASRVGSVIAVTPQLRADLMSQRGADPACTIVAHDGVRRARFEDLPVRTTARRKIGWDEDAFIVGYVGRLHTIGMDKGVATLVKALAAVEGAHLALVGGPDDMAQSLRQEWLNLGLSEDRFLYAGHVPVDDVLLYMSAFDVCAMPLPVTTHFAHYASPLKLFEYMAAGKRSSLLTCLPGLTWSPMARPRCCSRPMMSPHGPLQLTSFVPIASSAVSWENAPASG